MADVNSNLEAARLNISTILVEITEDPKPTYSIDGQSVSWESYLNSLVQQLDQLNKLIQTSSGPFEYRTQGVT